MKTKSLLILVLFVCLTVTASFGQSWSKEQQEVWKAVDEIWAVWAAGGNVDLTFSLIDDNYRGWSNNDPAPFTKKDKRPWMEFYFKNYPIEIYKINPMSIDIYNDIAIVFYYYQILQVKPDGTDMQVAGKWMDIYRKNGASWLLLADSGGAM